MGCVFFSEQVYEYIVLTTNSKLRNMLLCVLLQTVIGKVWELSFIETDWKHRISKYTTKSRNSEQTSFWSIYSEQSLTILNINWTYSNHYGTFWPETEHCWTFWTLTEQILNTFWTLQKILTRLLTFWALTEQSLNITEHSEHWLNRF
jgi:hypothetical protein